jgi:protein-L-isoaspartate(D-aspartate) O-methyltransferase
MSSDFAAQRKELVEHMKASGVVYSKSVENAFLYVKRELFFPKELQRHAYADTAFPVGFGQTISQPSTIAIMLEMLDARPGMKVLEVGAGSGYVIALLCELVGDEGKVFAVELISGLAGTAKENLLSAGQENFELKASDGTLGWKENAPFERILVSAACASVPKPLAGQLSEGGKLVAPLGSRFTQELVCMGKEKGGLEELARQGYFVFVPLRGKFAFG